MPYIETDAGGLEALSSFAERDRCRVLRDALLSLPDLQRRVLVLRWLKAEKYAVIADAVGMKKSAVATIHRDAMTGMRRWFSVRGLRFGDLV